MATNYELDHAMSSTMRDLWREVLADARVLTYEVDGGWGASIIIDNHDVSRDLAWHTQLTLERTDLPWIDLDDSDLPASSDLAQSRAQHIIDLLRDRAWLGDHVPSVLMLCLDMGRRNDVLTHVIRRRLASMTD